MKYKTVNFVIIILSLLLVSCISNPYDSLENNPKLDPKLVEIIKNGSLETVHAMIYFSSRLERDELKILNKMDIIYHDDTPGVNPRIATVPVLLINNITKLSSVNKLMSVPLQYKMIEYFAFEKIPSYVFNDDNSINLKVIFYDDVTKEEAISMITKYSEVFFDKYTDKNNEIYLHTVNNKIMFDLAREDKVKAINYGGDPSTKSNPLAGLVIVKTDKSSYNLSEIVYIFVYNGLNKSITLTTLIACEGEIYIISKYEGKEFKDYMMICGACMGGSEFRKKVESFEGIIFEWDQQAYTNPVYDCEKKHILGKGLYKVKIWENYPIIYESNVFKII
ncbi:hypothetical protein AYK26_01730 [Euryarchaeota archaeon SM23-78]|nr:MAG: hypothetical protein AYK26_01730 [Euryarchaeota archaeon SM23-78]MBW3000846.1 hypothetical protein [Candidatus Woesearchaeota archaeon]